MESCHLLSPLFILYGWGYFFAKIYIFPPGKLDEKRSDINILVVNDRDAINLTTIRK